MPSCRSCREPIRWAHLPGDKWLPLDPEPSPSGEYAFLEDGERAMQIDPEWRSLDSLPASLRESIPPEMETFWARLLESPRYRVHSLACRQVAASHIGRSIREVLG